MSQFYEERLERDLNRIRERVADVAARVEQALKDALRAVLHLDKRLANATVLGDMPINRATREIDRLCHYFVARHLPAAGHLRFISSVLRMNVALERIGDYAVTMAREAKVLSRPLGEEIQRDLKRMADEAFHMLHQAIEAFNDRNAELAKGTMGYAYQLDHTFSNAFDLLVKKGEEDAYAVVDLFGILIIFNRLERVSDQAKNICEETVFAVTGETKKPKVYRVLFLDEADDCRSQMAVAIARKAYPQGGAYTSAGLHPAAEVDPACTAFMAEHGHELNGSAPRRFEEIPEDWKDNHVVVSLEGPVERYVPEVPFHTIALEWEVPKPPAASAGEEEQRAAFEAIFRQLAANIGDLMETLHGEEAS